MHSFSEERGSKQMKPENPEFTAAISLLRINPRRFTLSCNGGFSPLETAELCKQLSKCDELEEVEILNRDEGVDLASVFNSLPSTVTTIECESCQRRNHGCHFECD